MINQNEREVETQGEDLQWLDGSWRWYTQEKLGTPERKIKHLEPRMWYDEPLRKEEIRSLGWNNNNYYVMRILHQLNLWQAMDCIQLILVERIKRDIAQTWIRSWWNHQWDSETTNELIWET